MVPIQSMFNSLLAIDNIDDLIEMVGISSREYDKFVVLRHFLEEVLGIGSKAICLFGMAHDLQEIDN